MRTDTKQLNFKHMVLRQILVWLEKETGLEFTETSSYRIGDNGVHGTLPVRGQDLRMRNFDIGTAIEKFINNNWQYDSSRPNKMCAVLHGEGADLHLHIQVCDKTRNL